MMGLKFDKMAFTQVSPALWPLQEDLRDEWVGDAGDNTNGFYEDLSEGNLAEEYTYDDNGNMITDANKGISSISYNYLNLPTRVITAEGVVNYTYTATGTKLAKFFDRTSGLDETTDYIAGIQYKDDIRDFTPHAEGRYYFASGEYNYDLKDHLGNTRVTLDGNGTVVQRSDFYPFGLVFNESVGSPENLYKFTGKESQPETGWVDFGARMYDASIGRWNHTDPLADKYMAYSPYNYTLNNPIKYIDPDGMRVSLWDEMKGRNGVAVSSEQGQNTSDDQDDEEGNEGGDSSDNQGESDGGVVQTVTKTFNEIGQGFVGWKDFYADWFAGLYDAIPKTTQTLLHGVGGAGTGEDAGISAKKLPGDKVISYDQAVLDVFSPISQPFGRDIFGQPSADYRNSSSILFWKNMMTTADPTGKAAEQWMELMFRQPNGVNGDTINVGYGGYFLKRSGIDSMFNRVRPDTLIRSSDGGFFPIE